METVARDHKLSCPWKQGWSCQHVSGWLSLHHPSSDPGSWKEVKEGGRGHKKSQERRPKYGIELRCTADSTGRSTVTAKGWELSSHSFQIYVNSNTGFLIFDATRYTFCTLDIQILCIIEIVYTWEDFFPLPVQTWILNRVYRRHLDFNLHAHCSMFHPDPTQRARSEYWQSMSETEQNLPCRTACCSNNPSANHVKVIKCACLC